jgi:small subunit ribosomal protein S21
VDNLLGRPLEVEVRDSLEKAMKILKQKMSKEGILQEVKRRRFYEKPSVKRKRKMREARKRRRREMKRRGGGGGMGAERGEKGEKGEKGPDKGGGGMGGGL